MPIQRIFIGRRLPTLPQAVSLLREQHSSGGEWDMSGVLVALPGAQAARRLRRLLHDEAGRAGLQEVKEPEIVTPAGLLERLYAPVAKAADPLTVSFAWLQAAALHGADQERLAPDIAREAARVRAAATAEGLTLAALAEKCRGGNPRWEALARLEAAYLDVLAAARLADKDTARMDALASGRVACDKVIYLIGAQDLNGLERAMLCALDSSVVAIIPAPEEEQEMFDETGSLRVDCWHNAPIPIPDDCLRFVDGPAEEAEALRGDVAALNGAFAPEEITVGVGDEAAAESLARRLGILGLPAFSPFGRVLSRVRPAALLAVVRDFLDVPTMRAFAALARHPDLEAWLTARQPRETLPLLTHLDVYRAACLPVGLPMGGGDDPTLVPAARESIAACAAAVQTLLAPLRDEKQPISGWATPIADLLREVYADTPLGDDTEGRQFARGLAGLQEILQGTKNLTAVLSPAVSGVEALDFVLGQAEAVRLPSEPPAGVGLEMMGWLELALDDAPVLLLTGLQEGCVPASVGDDSLLPDSLRRTLGLADDRRRQARDGLLLRLMIESRLSEGRQVRLIVPRRGADGDPRMPSRLLFACGPEEAALRAARFASRPPDAAPTPALFSTGPSLFHAGNTRDLPPPLPVPPDPPLAEMSISAFSDYLACPYRFYLRHVLKLEGLDDSQDEMDPRLFGNLVHDCLKAFANSAAAQSAKVAEIERYLHDRLQMQSRRRFGERPPRAVQMQVRQAGRRLEAFAAWQAQTVLDGWKLQSSYSEKDMEADMSVDGQAFTIKGRPDRVDYHPGSDRYRIIDYKTGDSGKGPEEKHRKKEADTGKTQWTDLQLPLYRVLLSQNNVSLEHFAASEMGYVLLSADLAPITYSDRNKRSGGSGFVSVAWTQADHDDALQCAENVIRSIRAGIFWPPADPPPFPPSRTDPGSADVYSGLCLDSCSDRRDWFGLGKEEEA